MHQFLLIVLFGAAFVTNCISQETIQPQKAFPILKTTDGVELRDVTVTTLDQTGVALSHADGTGRFDWSRISKADQIAMGFDVDKIAAQRAAAIEATQQKAAQLKQEQEANLALLRAKRLPEIKAAVATQKLTIGQLANALKETQTISGKSYFGAAKDIFGAPTSEAKNSWGELSGSHGKCDTFTFSDICYNPRTEKTEGFKLVLYHGTGEVALEPHSGESYEIHHGKTEIEIQADAIQKLINGR